MASCRVVRCGGMQEGHLLVSELKDPQKSKAIAESHADPYREAKASVLES